MIKPASTNPAMICGDFLREFDQLNDAVNFELSRKREKGLCPPWVFLPNIHWINMTLGLYITKPNIINKIFPLSFLATWSYSKGIYRFSDEIYQEVINTPFEGKIPADALKQLPEWCVYIETPGLKLGPHDAYGFWAMCDYIYGYKRTTLRLLFNTDKGLLLQDIILQSNSTIEESFAQQTSDASYVSQVLGLPQEAYKTAEEVAHYDLSQFVSLLLYICSDKPDFTDAKGKEATPQKAASVKTKRGRLFMPASAPKTITVGATLSQAIKAAKEHQSSNDKETNSKAPHLRRGHWQSYHTGPRNGEQKLVIHWIYPLIVNAN